MSRVYEALRGVVQGTLQRDKVAPMSLDRMKNGEDANLNGKMEELESMLVDWMGKFKVAVKEREAVVTNEVQHAEQIIEGLRSDVGALDATLKKTDETVQATEARFKALEQSLDARIEALEEQMQRSAKLVSERDRQINYLRSQVKLLRNGVKDASSFFRQAQEALQSSIELEDVGTAAPDKHLVQEEKEIAPKTNGTAVATNGKTVREIVSPKFFDRMTVALSHVVGPKASTLVRDHIAELGESIEAFPKARVPELVDTVSRDIPDENLRIGFREVLEL